MMRFQPRTQGSRSQGSTTKLWSIFKETDNILYIYIMKLQDKVGEPQETSLIQPSIQSMWAKLSIYNLGFNHLYIQEVSVICICWWFNRNHLDIQVLSLYILVAPTFCIAQRFQQFVYAGGSTGTTQIYKYFLCISWWFQPFVQHRGFRNLYKLVV